MENPYLVSARFVRNIFDIAVDVIHRFGHGGDVLLGCAGDGGVVDLVCHVCCMEFSLMGILSVAGFFG